MKDGAESACERSHPRMNHFRRVDVQWRSMSLRQLRKGSGLAEEFRVTIRRPVSERRRADNTADDASFRAAHHLRLPGPPAPSLMRIATTVWSSNGSTPAACSATALKILLTTQCRLGLASEDNFFQALLRKGPAIAVTRVEDPIAVKHEQIARFG